MGMAINDNGVDILRILQEGDILDRVPIEQNHIRVVAREGLCPAHPDGL